jgi:hypothetical protein
MQDPQEQLDRLKAKKKAQREANAHVEAKWGSRHDRSGRNGMGRSMQATPPPKRQKWSARMAAKPTDAVLPEATKLDISLRLDDAVETKGLRVTGGSQAPVDGSTQWSLESDRRLAAKEAADQQRPSDHVICTDWDDNTKELGYYRDENGQGYWNWKLAPKVIETGS